MESTFADKNTIVSKKSGGFGNTRHARTVAQFLAHHRIQAKLKISQPSDPMEQEANRIADEVMRSSGLPSLSVSSDQQNDRHEKLHRECADCEGELRRQAVNKQEVDVENSFEADLDNMRSGGRPLPKSERLFFESRMGEDFSRVRIHDGADAANLSRRINAHAFTTGQHIAFNRGAYRPETTSGKRLLAHELSHVMQQGDSASKTMSKGATQHIARQCAAGTASQPWSQRLTSAQNMAAGTAKHNCFVELIRAALGTGVTVHESTNTAATIGDAITAGHYTQRGTGTDVNYDANFNAKTGNANQYGQADFRTTGSGTANLTIYIILGPRALNTIGPEHTRMANQHEQDHASDYTTQAASGSPRAATAGDELRIYVRGLTGFLTDLVQVDTTNCSYNYSDDFSGVFNNYGGASTQQKNDAFNAISNYYTNTISGNSTNTRKFKVWFQSTMNSRSATDALVVRINALSGLDLTRGTSPLDHICPPSTP